MVNWSSVFSYYRNNIRLDPRNLCLGSRLPRQKHDHACDNFDSSYFVFLESNYMGAAETKCAALSRLARNTQNTREVSRPISTARQHISWSTFPKPTFQKDKLPIGTPLRKECGVLHREILSLKATHPPPYPPPITSLSLQYYR